MTSLRWIPVDSLSVWPLKERVSQLGRSLKSAVHPTKSANYEGHDIPKINPITSWLQVDHNQGHHPRDRSQKTSRNGQPEGHYIDIILCPTIPTGITINNIIHLTILIPCNPDYKPTTRVLSLVHCQF
jgi:hypothetical protein